MTHTNTKVTNNYRHEAEMLAYAMGQNGDLDIIEADTGLPVASHISVNALPWITDDGIKTIAQALADTEARGFNNGLIVARGMTYKVMRKTDKYHRGELHELVGLISGKLEKFTK